MEGGVATITLNRPAQRNRLENGDLKALLAHFDTVNRDPAVRVMVLTANTAGQPRPVFCAGFDIGGDTPEEFATFQAAEIARWKRVVEAGNIKPE